GRGGDRPGRRPRRDGGARDGRRAPGGDALAMRVLGIDVGERELRVARAVRAFGAVRLGAVERIAFADRAELAGALAQLAASRPQAVLTALPAALVTHRFVALPFRDRRRLAATVPLELLGQLPA